MTKRRPSWSERCLRAASLAGVCLLSLLPLPAPAADDEVTVLEGLASYYGARFQGRRTASGERFDWKKFTAASNRFPLGTRLAVLRPDNGLCVIVRVNDRMHSRHKARIVDLSRSAADYLEMRRSGVVAVRAAALPADAGPGDCALAFAPGSTGDAAANLADGSAADVEYNPGTAPWLRMDTGMDQ